MKAFRLLILVFVLQNVRATPDLESYNESVENFVIETRKKLDFVDAVLGNPERILKAEDANRKRDKAATTDSVSSLAPSVPETTIKNGKALENKLEDTEFIDPRSLGNATEKKREEANQLNCGSLKKKRDCDAAGCVWLTHIWDGTINNRETKKPIASGEIQCFSVLEAITKKKHIAGGEFGEVYEAKDILMRAVDSKNKNVSEEARHILMHFKDSEAKKFKNIVAKFVKLTPSVVSEEDVKREIEFQKEVREYRYANDDRFQKIDVPAVYKTAYPYKAFAMEEGRKVQYDYSVVFMEQVKIFEARVELQMLKEEFQKNTSLRDQMILFISELYAEKKYVTDLKVDNLGFLADKDDQFVKLYFLDLGPGYKPDELQERVATSLIFPRFLSDLAQNEDKTLLSILQLHLLPENKNRAMWELQVIFLNIYYGKLPATALYRTQGKITWIKTFDDTRFQFCKKDHEAFRVPAKEYDNSYQNALYKEFTLNYRQHLQSMNCSNRNLEIEQRKILKISPESVTSALNIDLPVKKEE